MLCTALLCACADTEKAPSSVAESSAQETTSTGDVTEDTQNKTSAENESTITTTTGQPATQAELGTPPPMTLISTEGLTETHDRSVFDTLSEPPYYFYTHGNSVYYYIITSDKSQLSYKGRQISYTDSLGDDCTDTYFYNSVKETETMINRHINGKAVFVNPVQIYINRQNDALYIKLRETGELVQTIKGDFSSDVDKYEGAGGLEEYYYQGVDVIEFADYDFDGYDDLFFQTTIHTANEPGVYYRFNPETCLFEDWDELNNIGHTLDIGISSNVSIGQTLSYSTSKPDEHETFIYKWENDKLILVERRITLIDNENNTAVTELYYIDDNGNEILIESAERDLNEHPLDFD